MKRILNGEAYQRLIVRDGEHVLDGDGNPLTEPQPAVGAYRERLQREEAALLGKIAYWEDLIAQAEAQGVKVWKPSDFTPGDFALSGGRWYEVLKKNTESLTIPWSDQDTDEKILRRSQAFDRLGGPSVATDRLTYGKVQGRMSAIEAARKFPPRISSLVLEHAHHADGRPR
ncbi:hypothetical protein ACFV1N_46000 [Streptosporangium canum]|uniref:hypothetical protein n=1 Tax=Streptosporangium canum TaxID=324952 RepID=UPI00368C5E69